MWEPEEGNGSPWNWVYRWMGAVMYALGIKPESSARTYRAISRRHPLLQSPKSLSGILSM